MQEERSPATTLFGPFRGNGSGRYQVITGALGLQAEIDVFGSHVPPMAAPSATDPGLVAAMSDYIVNGNPSISVINSFYYAPVTYLTDLLFAFQHHNVLYLTINRFAIVQHTASLTYQVDGSFGQGIISTGSLGPSVVSVYSGDIITIAIDLDTKQLTAFVASLLEGPVSVSNYFYNGAQSRYEFTVVDTRPQQTPYLQIYNTIPAAHPLKSFGADLWKGDYPLPTPLKTASVYLFQINFMLNNCLGYGDQSATKQRLIKKSKVIEWAEVNFNSLEAARRLGEAWPNSYADYSVNSLVSRDELLDVSELPAADQTAFLTPYAIPPSIVGPGSAQGGATENSKFFLESQIELDTGQQLSFTQGMLTYLRYRILE